MVVIRKPSSPVLEVPEAPVVVVVPVAPVEAQEVPVAAEEVPVSAEVSEAPEVSASVEVSSVVELLAKGFSEVVAQITAGIWDSQISELYAYESSNKKRKSVISALELRKSSLQA